MSKMTPIKSIRAKCLDCCGGSSKEVRNCTAGESCPLFPYRLGKRPASRKDQGDTERTN